MTAAEAPVGPSANAVLEAAREYARRGWRVVPVPRGEKGPHLKAWHKLRLEEVDLPRYFRGSENVGLLLGEVSGGVVDCDLDCREAIAAAELWLPPTDLIHGRPSKPKSHRWYVCEPIVKSQRFSDADGTCLIELRSSGLQTVVPPSLHPSGERIRWESKGEPARVSADSLRRGVAWIAAIAILARHWPKEGSRHEASKGLAGLLLLAGWGEEETKGLVEAVAQAAGDEEFRARGADVRTTARRLTEGRPATGGPSLAELVGKGVVDRVREWLALRPAGNGTTDIQSVPDLHREIRTVVLNQGTPAFDKRRTIARLIELELGQRGKFLRTSDGRAFFFHGEERRLFDLEQTAFQHLLTAVSGLSATESFFTFTLDVLQAKNSREAPLTEVYSFAYFDIATGVVAVSDGAGGIWLRERGSRWALCHNGDHGLLFLTEPEASGWIPEFNGGSHPREWFLNQFLFASAPLSIEDAKTLLHVWITQQFFPPLRRTRLIPAFLGPQGSGKTTAQRLLGQLLVGPTFDVTGVQREKQDAFVAAVTNRVILGIDNADAKIFWLPDSLALYATGQRYRLRRLYRTNEEVSYSPRAILTISSRDPQFNRPDVTERLLPLYFDRPQVYRTEEEIFRQLETRRGAILGSILDHVGQIADALPNHPPIALPFRMADFACFGARLFAVFGRSDEWVELLGRLEHVQAAFASDGDGLILALKELLRQEGGSFEMPVRALFGRCLSIAQSENLLFPRTAQGFGRRLSTMRRIIELELGVTFQDSRGHADERFVRLQRRDGGDGGDPQ